MPVVLRDIFRGLGDTFENLLAYTMMSLGWWLSLVLIIPAPGSTIALLVATDPRRVHTTARPGLREGVVLTERYLARGWIVAAIAAPPLVVAGFNLWSYQAARGLLIALAPLWIVVLVAVAAMTAVTLSCIALFDDSLVDGVRRAGAIVVRRPLAVVLVLGALWGLLLVSMALVVPLFMFYPPMAAAMLHRFVLRTLDIPVPDPLEPSEEREAEEQRSRTASQFGP